MQNEITELRNQVRTLKRIVCLACCLFGVFVFMGCRTVRPEDHRTYTSDNMDEKTLLGIGAIAVLNELLKEEN